MFPDKSVSASFLIIDVWQTHVSPVRWANRYIYRDSFFTFAMCSCTACSQSTAGLLSFCPVCGLRPGGPWLGRPGAFRQRSEYSTGCVCALQSCNTCHFLHGRGAVLSGAGAGCAMCPELPICFFTAGSGEKGPGFPSFEGDSGGGICSQNTRKLYL